jgi:hypothetical protein
MIWIMLGFVAGKGSNFRLGQVKIRAVSEIIGLGCHVSVFTFALIDDDLL